MRRVEAANIACQGYQVMRAEAEAILSARQELYWPNFIAAVDLLSRVKNLVLVSGMGKVGHVGERFAATLSSTGTPACFLHPAEAAHGDLGLISGGNLLVALSNSGKTREVLEMVAGARALSPRTPVLVVTGDKTSPLYKAGTLSLCYGKVEEPCPLGLTPTASLAVLSALLDALALCVMRRKGFTAADFSRRHHKGYLGVKARRQAGGQAYGDNESLGAKSDKEKGASYGKSSSKEEAHA